MNMDVVFIRNTCPSEKDLDLLSRPVSLCTNNGKRKCLAPEDRAVVHAGSIGILVAPGADGRPVPARGLTPARIHVSTRRSWSCVREGRADNGWFGSERSSRVAFGICCV